MHASEIRKSSKMRGSSPMGTTESYHQRKQQ